MKINGTSQIKANSIPLSALQQAAVAQLGGSAPQSEVYPADYATVQEFLCPFVRAGDNYYPAPPDADVAYYLNGNTPVEGQTFAAKFVALDDHSQITVAILTRQADGTWKAQNPDEPSTMLLPFGAVVAAGPEKERKYYVATHATFKEIEGVSDAQLSIAQTNAELARDNQRELKAFQNSFFMSLFQQRSEIVVTDPADATINTGNDSVVFHVLTVNGIQLRSEADYTGGFDELGRHTYTVKPENVQVGDIISLTYLTGQLKPPVSPD